jgi:hypothetical protein
MSIENKSETLGNRFKYPYGVDPKMDFDVRLSKTAELNVQVGKFPEVSEVVSRIKDEVIQIQERLMERVGGQY